MGVGVGFGEANADTYVHVHVCVYVCVCMLMYVGSPTHRNDPLEGLLFSSVRVLALSDFGAHGP